MIARSALLLAAACGCAFAQTHPITGTVTNAVTSAPIGRARVTLQGSNVNQIVLTDAGGSFTFGGVPAGSYNLSAERSGFFAWQLGPQPMHFAGVIVDAEKKPDPVALRLSPAATLTGTVTDENGFPLPAVNVQLVRRVITEGRAKLVNVNQGSGNDLGEFRISGLEPGSYLVCVNAFTSSYQRRHRMAYPTTCFPNVNDPVSAQWINVGAGEERNLEFRLAPVRGTRVSGAVANGSNAVSISVRRTDPPGFPQLGTPHVEWDSKNATFEMPAVVPGDYLITATAYRPDGQNARAMRAVHVGTEELRDIQLVLRDGPYVSGIVRMGNTAVPSESQVGANLNGDNLLSIYANASGSFKAPINESGDYSVMVFPPGGWSVQSITQGGVDIRDRKIAVGMDTDPAPIEVVLVQGGGGTVEVSFPSDLAKASSFVKLTLLRRSPNRNEWAMTGQAVPANTARNVNLPNLAAGDYLLFAWPMPTEAEYLNPEVIQKYKSFGQAVSVREGETTRVTVQPARVE